MRITKEYEERRNEILDVAETLFVTKGYLKTTINDILQEVGIAKGTFYYYFKSKEEVMDAIIIRFVSAGVKVAKEIISNTNLTVHEKLFKIIMEQKTTTNVKEEMISQLHQINNAQMHQKSLVETIKEHNTRVYGYG
ncbi:TetR/AcrR family transcriptional regulator [Marinisporobacter balticus]|uniref:TetR family transcriptional regulator n=1 Tax=Marinisporobacter balticus TaxID=2018667 RepID=A0A4R2KCT4_9FIRM|nr:TetR/AcrR family transcriptional regulator [Marinisporobacter balticus]TCO70724.1 TetR family transcriptional regulator [Marinisporobacter balticus]